MTTMVGEVFPLSPGVLKIGATGSEIDVSCLVNNATLTTDKCCSFHHANHDGTKEKGYFVCTAKDGKIGRSFVEVKVP